MNRKPALVFIFITILVDVIGMGIVIPVLPVLIENLIEGDIIDASKYAAWLMSTPALMQFLFAPLLGGLSDKYGRRPVLLIALLGLGLDYIFHGLAPTIFWLFIGRIIAGIAGGSITVAAAYIADVSTPEKRAQNFGLIGMAFGLGFTIGPVIGGVFSQFGVRVPFFIAAGLSILNFIYGLIVVPESLSVQKRRAFSFKRANPIGSFKHLKKYTVLTGLFITIFLIYLGGHSVHSTWAYYTMFKFEWDEQMVGYSLGFVGIVVAIVQGGLIRIVIPKIGANNAVITGLILYSVGALLFGLAYDGWMMFAILIPYALGGIAGPAIRGILSNNVAENEQGELQGTITSIMSVTSIFGPLLMNNIFYFFTSDKTNVFMPGAPYYLGAILFIIGVYTAIRSLKKITIKENTVV